MSLHEQPEPTSTPSDALERGLAAAFRPRPGASVPETLSQRTGVSLGLHLPPAAGEEPQVRLPNPESAAGMPRSPRYQVLGELASGGVGVVYHARDVDLGRDVAMKVLRPEHQNEAGVVQRFVEEAQIGGQLQHPGIVPVYEFGLQHGERPFFTMKLVQGETLAALLNARPDPLADRRRFLSLFEQVCLTVAYAHARRVVHRDLKPSNVMVGAFGEVQVVDWGFAKVLLSGGIVDELRAPSRAPAEPEVATVRTRPGSRPTLAGSVFGTPEYMPPEQARGEVEHMNERSDVFSLGAILCEVLTGLPPYASIDGDVLDLARDADTSRALARLERSGAARELRALVAQCLAADPVARPAGARQVAEQVGAYLAAAEEQVRAARTRLRTTQAVGATVLAALLVGVLANERSRDAAAQRSKRASALVATALQEVQELRGRAQERADDPRSWEAALHAAQKATALAAAPDVEQDLQQRAAFALAEVDATAAAARRAREKAASEAALVARLIEVRVPGDDTMDRPEWALDEAVRLAQGYERAFAEHGIDLDAAGKDPDRFGASYASIAVPVAAALDHWGIELRRLVLLEGPQLLNASKRASLLDRARRHHTLAAALDGGDDWRNRLRAALTAEAIEAEGLRQLAATAAVDGQPALYLLTLAAALSLAGAEENAIALLRRAQVAHPADGVLALLLGYALERRSPTEATEAFSLYRIAHALRPDMRETRHRAGHALLESGEHDRAARMFEQLAAEEPRYQWFHHAGRVRDYLNQPEAAARLLRAALACDPEPWDPTRIRARADLAQVQTRLGEVDEAIEALRSIVEEAPGRSEYHFSLGVALGERAVRLGLPEGATLLEHPAVKESLECYRRCLALNPAQFNAHYNIGNTLMHAGKFDLALEEFRKELEHYPTHTGAYNNLGWSLFSCERFEESAEAWRKVVELDPVHVFGWTNLGASLRELERNDEALEALQTALRLAPDHRTAHVNMALLRGNRSEWMEAVASWERCVRLDPTDDYCAQGLEFARDLRARSVVWNALIDGLAPAEEVTLEVLFEAAHFAYATERFARSAALYEAALTRSATEQVEPEPRHGYDAACAAVLASSGAGNDAAELAAEERARLRGMAESWLRRRLALWQGQGGGEARAGLEHWLTDADLASVRELSALSALPEAEAERWTRLWGEVVTSLAALR